MYNTQNKYVYLNNALYLIIFCIFHEYFSQVRSDFSGSSDSKESACNAGDLLDPWVGNIPWRRKWQPTPLFLPENTMDRGAWQATVTKSYKELQRVTKSQT